MEHGHNSFLKPSNNEVADRVAAGEFAFGVADTDDYSVAFKGGKPVRPSPSGRSVVGWSCFCFGELIH